MIAQPEVAFAPLAAKAVAVTAFPVQAEQVRVLETIASVTLSAGKFKAPETVKAVIVVVAKVETPSIATSFIKVIFPDCLIP